MPESDDLCVVTTAAVEAWQRKQPPWFQITVLDGFLDDEILLVGRPPEDVIVRAACETGGTAGDIWMRKLADLMVAGGYAVKVKCAASD